MNPPSRMGRAIFAVRRLVNSIGLRTFGIGIAVATFLILWALMGSAYIPSGNDLQAGDVAASAIRAPSTLTFENTAQTDRQRQQAADQVEKVYSFDGAVLPNVIKNINGYFDSVARITGEETAAAQTASRPYDPGKAAARIEQLSSQSHPIEAGAGQTLAALDPARLAGVRSAVLDADQRILVGNVTDATLANDRDRLRSLLETSQLTPDEISAANAVGSSFLEPNNIYDAEATQQARQQAAAAVPAAIVTIRSGETIVSAGQAVTSDQVAALQAFGISGQGGSYGAIAGIGLLCAIEVALMAAYIERFERRVSGSRSLMFIVASLLVLFTALDRVMAIPPLSPLLVPMAALGMLGTMMLQTRLAVITVLVAGINITVTGGPDPVFILTALAGGVTGAFLVTHVAQRRDLVKAGLYALLIVTVTAIGASQIAESGLRRVGEALLWGLGNGFLAIVVTLGLMTIYEMVFNLPTPLKLLELADPTRPLLKELMMKAPGTYNHSIIMGNIAETAAEAIGANPLLARVGAYYHDIGKLNRPDYFIENQFHIKNPHDRLTPGLSRLAITAHVKDGVRLATDEGLPPEIVDIIKEHHGTTVLSYFYHKAQVSGQGQVEEETYRYAGTKPASREAAIIMLADSVEAAVRSLGNPTMKSIKGVIRDIFEQRLRDGQLSESKMTFGDLEKVRLVFEKSLRGFAATRIAYPSKREPRGPAEGGTRGQAGGEGHRARQAGEGSPRARRRERSQGPAPLPRETLPKEGPSVVPGETLPPQAGGGSGH